MLSRHVHLQISSVAGQTMKMSSWVSAIEEFSCHEVERSVRSGGLDGMRVSCDIWTQGSPAERCIVTLCSMIFTSPVSGFNVVAQRRASYPHWCQSLLNWSPDKSHCFMSPRGLNSCELYLHRLNSCSSE